MGFFKNFLGKVFDEGNENQNEQSFDNMKSEKVEKTKFPEELQLQIVMNMLSVAELQKITEIYELKSHHWNLVGNSYRHFQKYELAEEAFLNSIERDPSNEEPYGNLMLLYILIKEWEKYENTYRKGMDNANPRSFIVYQDGRYHFLQGNYDMAYSAALSVLTATKLQDENAWGLAVNSLIYKSGEETDDNLTVEFFNQAKEMLSKGLSVFPNSQQLLKLKEKFFED